MKRSILDDDSNSEIKILFFNLRGYRRSVQFILLTIVIFMFHCVQGLRL
jgi:hypothetical protein